MADNFQSSKVAANEQSSSTKFNNFVQAAEDAINSLDNSNIAAAAAVVVSKLAAGSNGDLLQTVAGVPTWVTGGYSTYAPTWAASGAAPVLGDGVMSGRFVQIGKLVVGRISLVAGSTTTYGTGTYTWTLPVTANGPAIYTACGTWTFLDSSGGFVYPGIACHLNTTTLLSGYTAAQPGSQLAQTVPVAWTVGDTLQISFAYEAV